MHAYVQAVTHLCQMCQLITECCWCFTQREMSFVIQFIYIYIYIYKKTQDLKLLTLLLAKCWISQDAPDLKKAEDVILKCLVIAITHLCVAIFGYGMMINRRKSKKFRGNYTVMPLHWVWMLLISPRTEAVLRVEMQAASWSTAF